MIGIHAKSRAHVWKIIRSYFVVVVVVRIEIVCSSKSYSTLIHLNFLRRLFFVAGNTNEMKRERKKLHTLYNGRRNNNSFNLGLYFMYFEKCFGFWLYGWESVRDREPELVNECVKDSNFVLSLLRLIAFVFSFSSALHLLEMNAFEQIVKLSAVFGISSFNLCIE